MLEVQMRLSDETFGLLIHTFFKFCLLQQWPILFDVSHITWNSDFWELQWTNFFFNFQLEQHQFKKHVGGLVTMHWQR